MKSFKRNIETAIKNILLKEAEQVLVLYGARQIGKTFIINKVANEIYKNVIYINFDEDFKTEKLFYNVKNKEMFYLLLNTYYGDEIGTYEDTIIFLDEIQTYPYIATFFKSFIYDKKYHFVASGSLLGIELRNILSLSLGYSYSLKMFQLNFHEFLLANGVKEDVISYLEECFKNKEHIEEAISNKIMQLFKSYLIIGGLPRAVEKFIEDKSYLTPTHLIEQIYQGYKNDASKYDEDNKLHISYTYNLIRSNLSNKLKRVKVKDMYEYNSKKTFKDYFKEFDYLDYSGIALRINAVHNANYPLSLTISDTLMKYYYNDTGIYRYLVFGNNFKSILDDALSINLGSLYETYVASELKTRYQDVYYYLNKQKGEVDFLVDDLDNSLVKLIEVKSGKDYKVHSAINNLLKENPNNKAYVLASINDIEIKDNITYLPIYMTMFI